MKILLLRHGETTGDIEDRYGGTYDDHLTEKGKRQVRLAAASLASRGIERIFVSPLARAQETAAIVREHLTMPIETIPELREQDRYGPLSGIRRDEARGAHPDWVAMANDRNQTIPGAEPYSAFRARLLGALNKISLQPSSVVLVITHGGPIRCVLRDILQQGEADIADCALLDLETEPRLRIVELQGIHFLGGGA